MITTSVISAGLVVVVPPVEQVSPAMKQCLGVVSCHCLKTSVQWDLPSGQA
jgi:hypothetical protein